MRLLLATLALLAACKTEPVPQPAQWIDGQLSGHAPLEEYEVYRPRGWQPQGAALLVFHGAGGAPRPFIDEAQLVAVADETGLALIAPYGPTRVFATGFETSWDASSEIFENQDVAFSRAVLEAARVQLGGISRVYVLGYSQGGFFGFHWVTAEPALFAGMAVHAAADPAPEGPLEPSAMPVNLVVGQLDFPVDGARESVPRLRAAGYQVRYDELPNHMHDLVPERVRDSVHYLLSFQAP